MATGKRALVIVLHGCDQSSTQIKDWGNVASTADSKGAVIALPYVGSNHVYITGLSSGASLAMLAACKAPDLIAGVGAIAGPSVGSMQFSAITEEGGIFHTATTARDKCKALAGAAKLPYFDTQIANITYAEMDKNAEKPGCKFSSGSTSCPGTFQLVSKKWSTINADMYGLIYGTGSLGAPVAVPDGTRELRKAFKNGQSRLALTRIYNVGHAWPAGSGLSNDVNKGGVWMAQSGMNYTNYIVNWFMENNIRKPQDPSPVMTSCAANSNSRTSIAISGAATDNGSVVSYQVKLNGPTPYAHVQAGRAYTQAGYAYAKGSGVKMGLYNLFFQTKLAESAPGHFIIGNCPG